jgi:UDP-N-acetylglucosamine/UDP-N-acetylgalactosamine diphosphorylase
MGNCCGKRDIGGGATVLSNPRLHRSQTLGFDSCKARFVESGQHHIFDHIDKLTYQERTDFVKQLNHVDPEEIHKIYMDLCTNQQPLSPSKYGSLDPSHIQSTSDEKTMEEYKKEGLKCIKEGRAGALILAGGMATRLGIQTPKGCYKIGTPSNKPLF